MADWQESPTSTLKIQNFSQEAIREEIFQILIAGTFRNLMGCEALSDLTRVMYAYYSTLFWGSMSIAILECTPIPNLVTQNGELKAPSPFVEITIKCDDLMHSMTTDVLMNENE